MQHFLQMLDGSFASFDYGSSQNIKIYGNDRPPIYDIGNVEVPTKLYVAENDEFSPLQSTKKLASQIKNLIGLHIIPDKSWSHLDFAFSPIAGEVILNQVVEDLTNL